MKSRETANRGARVAAEPIDWSAVPFIALVAGYLTWLIVTIAGGVL